MKLKDRIFVALDVSEDKFYELVEKLSSATHFKIGFPLFLRVGEKGIRLLKDKGKKIFLDFKFFDIPNTMVESSKGVVDLGADFFTVHLSSGSEHLKRVVESVKERSGGRAKVLGVTVLTSFSEETLKEINVSGNIISQVLRLAEIGFKAGVDGIVSSPWELEPLRKNFEDRFFYVTPGIRPFRAAKDDQKRTMNFSRAISAGATYVVIGRPITQAENPEEAFKRILEEVK